MWASSTHKFIAASITVAVMSLMALFIVLAIAGYSSSTEKAKARAAACAVHASNPRDVAICIKLTK